MPEEGITVGEIREWLKEEITQEFFKAVRYHLEDADRMVHKSLENNEKEEAALHNAGMVQIQEILDIPERMIEDLKED